MSSLFTREYISSTVMFCCFVTVDIVESLIVCAGVLL